LSLRHLPDIGGDWQSQEVNVDESYSYQETMHISQHGWKVCGTIEYQEKPNKDASKKARKVFRFDGIFKERVLAVTYTSQDKRSLSTGNTLLFLSDDNTFEGGCVYYDPRKKVFG
jgi:hypothetical protein